MKALIILLILLSGAIFFFRSGLFAQGTPGSLAYNPYKDYPVYTGNDLGVHYAKSGTILKIWSPPAQEMKLKLYKTSTGYDLMEEILSLIHI